MHIIGRARVSASALASDSRGATWVHQITDIKHVGVGARPRRRRQAAIQGFAA